MAATARKVEAAAGDPIAVRLAERIGRIAWLTAHCHHVAPAAILRKPRFDADATRARMVAIALSRDLLSAPLPALSRAFGENPDVMAAACNRVAERAERDTEFRTSLNFLKASCAAALGLG